MSRGGIQGFQGDRLSQILAARRLTQVQLASMVGVSPATISKWRAGTFAVSWGTQRYSCRHLRAK